MRSPEPYWLHCGIAIELHRERAACGVEGRSPDGWPAAASPGRFDTVIIGWFAWPQWCNNLSQLRSGEAMWWGALGDEWGWSC